MIDAAFLQLLAAAGLLSVGAVIGVVLLLAYPRLKLLVSDIFRLAGGFGKWFRKKSIETEVEGAINLFSRNFNAELSSPLLPGCKVEWVTEENQEHFIQEGKAIVRLSFSAGNHDLNLYNATHTFVKTGLLPKTKPYLRKTTAGAFDQLLTKILLLQSARRQALTIFNHRFKDEPDELKNVFHKLEEAEYQGLFRPILLQELYFFGDLIGNKAPKQSYEDETERFVKWLYDLAMRDEGEKSDLKFTSEHIKVGVILVADSHIYEKYGLSPYLRRAMWYASNDFNAIYLCSRGATRGTVTKQIARDLASKRGFEILTKRSDVIRHDADGHAFKITCIAIKPDLTTILQDAWASLTSVFEAKALADVTIKEVLDDHLVVDAGGLRVEILKKDASALAIRDLRRYFEPEQQLHARIIALDPDSQTVQLSNRDTDTDPKKLIESLQASLDAKLPASVTRIITMNDQEVGVNVSLEGKPVPGYIPRNALTYSRFLPLSSKFPIGSKLTVIPVRVDITHKNYVCKIDGLADPWSAKDKYPIGTLVTTTIRQVAERRITCELEEGLEGIVPVSELSWGSFEENLQSIKTYEVGHSLPVTVTGVDEERRQFLLSIKRLATSPVQAFYELNKDVKLPATIVSVSPTGAELTLDGTSFAAYLPAREVMWGYCRDVRDQIKPGSTIIVVLLSYNQSNNNLLCSHKRTTQNAFEEFAGSVHVGDTVSGTPYAVLDDTIRIRIQFGQGLIAEGYVHKSELTSLAFVDERLLREFLDMGKEYRFLVKRVDAKFMVVELSRKQFLTRAIESLKYDGTPYPAKIISLGHRYIACTDSFEGTVIEENARRRNYDKASSVIVARVDRQRNRVEVTLAK